MWNAIRVLWKRQLIRYFRSPARIIGAVGQPLLFLLAFGFGFGPIFAKAGEGSYMQFLAPGIISMAIVFSSMFSGIELIWDRQFGFLKETLVAPVPRAGVFLGRVLGGASTGAMQGVVVFIVTLFAGFRPALHPTLLLTLVFAILLAVFFTALGTIVATQLRDMQAFPLIMNFLVMPMYFLSGSLFPISNGSSGIKLIATLNPLSYGVDGFRSSLFGSSWSVVGPDLGIFLGLTVALLAIGAMLFQKMEA